MAKVDSDMYLTHPSQYEDEPVFYCKHCHSLRIMVGDGFGDYCDDCGSTDIGQCHINEWLAMKEEDKNKSKKTQRKLTFCKCIFTKNYVPKNPS